MPVTVTCSRCGKVIDDVVYEVHVMGVIDNGVYPLGRVPYKQLHWRCLSGWARNKNR